MPDDVTFTNPMDTKPTPACDHFNYSHEIGVCMDALIAHLLANKEWPGRVANQQMQTMVSNAASGKLRHNMNKNMRDLAHLAAVGMMYECLCGDVAFDGAQAAAQAIMFLYNVPDYWHHVPGIVPVLRGLVDLASVLGGKQ